MKKGFILLLILPLLSLKPDSEKTIYQTKFLKGKVSVLEEQTYFVNELGEKSKILLYTYKYKFDKLGNLLEESYLKNGGENFSKKTFIYDSKGKLIRLTDERKATTSISRFYYFYNKKKQLETKIIRKFNGDKLIDMAKFSYDKNGNETEFLRYGEDSTKVISKSIIRYNLSNQKTEGAQFKDDLKTISIRTLYTYDDKGDKIEEVGLDEFGNQFKQIIYKYDANHNNIELKHYGGNGKTLNQFTSSKYDENHNLIELNYHEPSGGVQEANTYEFTFDKIGNWTKQIKKTNGTMNGLVERIITYH